MDDTLYTYQYRVITDIGEIKSGAVMSRCSTWEICKLFEINFNCEVLEIKKIHPSAALTFLLPNPYTKQEVA